MMSISQKREVVTRCILAYSADSSVAISHEARVTANMKRVVW